VLDFVEDGAVRKAVEETDRVVQGERALVWILERHVMPVGEALRASVSFRLAGAGDHDYGSRQPAEARCLTPFVGSCFTNQKIYAEL